MSQAKLIKQGTPSQQKSAAQPATQVPITKVVGKVVKGWVNDRRSVSQTDARRAFDALFG
jgi:hypothetical protein